MIYNTDNPTREHTKSRQNERKSTMKRIETGNFITYHFTDKHEAEKEARKHGKRAESYKDANGKTRHYFIIEK